jgi:hypothetical protein
MTAGDWVAAIIGGAALVVAAIGAPPSAHRKHLIISSILLVTFAAGVGTGSLIEKATGDRSETNASAVNDSTLSSTTPKPTTSPSTTATPGPPTSTRTPSPPSSPPSAPAAETPPRVVIGDQTYFDLDTQRASVEDGPAYDFKLSYQRVLPGDGVTIKAVADDQATSFANCDAATNIIVDGISLYAILEDETLCIFTDQGAWATLKVVNAEASGDSIVFDVQVFVS